MPAPLKIFFDGGCRAGRMETAVVAAGHATIIADAGLGSSEDAEWLALLHALRIAQGYDREVVLLGDSRSVIAQATGTGRVRDTGIAHLATLRALAPERLRIRWIKRQQNLAGIALARLHPR
ncbi:MAG TPA: reverse transcriptase-like protein [Sphingomonas sp.]|jgi:ribonuclease HI